MNIRKTKLEEIPALMEIFAYARDTMRQNGNHNQWINGYPNWELIYDDILQGNSYVCLESDNIVGTFCFSQGIDPTYLKIYEGKWLNNESYGVVHRIAVRMQGRGVASYCLNWCFSKCHNIRIDTHRDNQVMQNVLTKNGYLYCGIIHLQNGEERLAYQKY